jgi:hypothetical protein
MKGGGRFFEAHDTGPPLIDICTLGDLGELLGKPCHDAASVDATHFQGNYLAPAFSCILEEPVRVFLPLHAADHAPCPVSMDQGRRHRLGTVLRDPVVVMLIDLAQVSPWPRKQTATQDSFQIQGDPARLTRGHSSPVRAPRARP